MLTLSCKDSKNRLIHVATAVTRKEDASTYRYIFSAGEEKPRITTFLDDRRTTSFSDGLRGSPAAMKAEAPLAQHSTCAKHVISNSTPSLWEYEH